VTEELGSEVQGEPFARTRLQEGARKRLQLTQQGNSHREADREGKHGAGRPCDVCWQ
jgi:hypothetical protein